MDSEMQPKEWADQQREILERHAQWVAEEGGMELPVQLDTYKKASQIARLQWLNRHKQGTLLDVGCSWGYPLSVMSGDAGVDINPHLLDIARLLAPQREFVEGDARNLPFESNSFDTVVIAETLEHLPWIDGVAMAIGEAYRVARKKILVTVPHYSSDEAESFKHAWLAGAEEQAAIVRMLGGHVSKEHTSQFVCFSCTLP